MTRATNSKQPWWLRGMSLLFKTPIILLVLSSFSSITSFLMRKRTQTYTQHSVGKENTLRRMELLATRFPDFWSRASLAEQRVFALLGTSWILAQKPLSDLSQYLQKNVLRFGTGLCWGEQPCGKGKTWVWILALLFQRGFSPLQLGITTVTSPRCCELSNEQTCVQSWHRTAIRINIIINNGSNCRFRNLLDWI